MLKALIAIAICCAALSTAAARELVTPPPDGQPLPQGVPVGISGGEARVISLRYAIVDGRRVLIDAATQRVVYVLKP